MQMHAIGNMPCKFATNSSLVVLTVAFGLAGLGLQGQVLAQESNAPPIDFSQELGEASGGQDTSAAPDLNFDEGLNFSDSQAGDDVNFELDDDIADFGEEDFELPADPAEAEKVGTIAMIIGAVCCGVPAFLLGLLVGFFIGRRRSK